VTREPMTATADSMQGQFARVKAAVANLPFPNGIDVTQEVDGTIYVTGYVEEPVQRRAVLNSVRDTGVAARVRIPVLAQIRNEAANLLSEENADLSFRLSDKGVLTLTGVMFDEKRAGAL